MRASISVGSSAAKACIARAASSMAFDLTLRRHRHEGIVVGQLAPFQEVDEHLCKPAKRDTRCRATESLPERSLEAALAELDENGAHPRVVERAIEDRIGGRGISCPDKTVGGVGGEAMKQRIIRRRDRASRGFGRCAPVKQPSRIEKPRRIKQQRRGSGFECTDTARPPWRATGRGSRHAGRYAGPPPPPGRPSGRDAR